MRGLILILAVFDFASPNASAEGPCPTCPVQGLSALAEAKESMNQALSRSEKRQISAKKNEVATILANRQVRIYRGYQDQLPKLVNEYKIYFESKTSRKLSRAEVLEALRSDDFPRKLENRRELWKSNGGDPENQNQRIQEERYQRLKTIHHWPWIKDKKLLDALLAGRQEAILSFAVAQFEKERNLTEGISERVYRESKLRQFKGDEDEVTLSFRDAGEMQPVYDENGIKGVLEEFSKDLNLPNLQEPDHTEALFHHLTRKDPHELSELLVRTFPEAERPEYCFLGTTLPADSKKQIPVDLPGQTTESGPSDSGKDPPMVRSLTCDLQEGFKNNQSEVGENAKRVLEDCIKTVHTNCPSGIQSIRPTVESCASTLRTNDDRFKNNLELARARKTSMESEFWSQAGTILGMTRDPKPAPVDDLELSKDQNIYEIVTDGKPVKQATGTCGPRPPGNLGDEDWISLAASSNACIPSSNQESFQECLLNKVHSDWWRCKPKSMEEARVGTLSYLKSLRLVGSEKSRMEDRIKEFESSRDWDPYSMYRKAKISMQYTCKNSEDRDREPAKPAVGPSVTWKQIVDDLKSKYGLGITCVHIRANLYTRDSDSSKTEDPANGQFCSGKECPKTRVPFKKVWGF